MRNDKLLAIKRFFAKNFDCDKLRISEQSTWDIVRGQKNNIIFEGFCRDDFYVIELSISGEDVYGIAQGYSIPQTFVMAIKNLMSGIDQVVEKYQRRKDEVQEMEDELMIRLFDMEDDMEGAGRHEKRKGLVEKMIGTEFPGSFEVGEEE